MKGTPLYQGKEKSGWPIIHLEPEDVKISSRSTCLWSRAAQWSWMKCHVVGTMRTAVEWWNLARQAVRGLRSKLQEINVSCPSRSNSIFTTKPSLLWEKAPPWLVTVIMNWWVQQTRFCHHKQKSKPIWWLSISQSKVKLPANGLKEVLIANTRIGAVLESGKDAFCIKLANTSREKIEEVLLCIRRKQITFLNRRPSLNFRNSSSRIKQNPAQITSRDRVIRKYIYRSGFACFWFLLSKAHYKSVL